MQFLPTEEQAAFVAGLRRMVGDLGGSALVRAAMERDDGIATELWKTLGEVGVFGLPVPEERGGQGAGWSDCCLTLETLAGVLCEGPVLVHLLAIMLTDRFGDNEQRQRWLPKWLSGQERAAVMFDAVGTSVPFAANSTAIVAVSRGRWWVVPCDSPGVHITPVAMLDPSWRCADVVIERATWEQGRPLANSTLGSTDLGHNLALAGVASAQVGLAQACVDVSVAYAKERRQFDRVIGSFQAVQHHCADMYVALESARSIAWEAAWCADHAPEELAVSAATAAAWCGNAAFEVAGTAIQVHGGIGFTWEHDCHLLFKRAELLKRLFGSATQHRAKLRRAAGL